TDHPAYVRDINAGYERKGRTARRDPEVRNQIVMKAVAKHILVDWRGVEDDDGNPVTFDRDLVIRWSNDLINYGRFLGAVLSAAIEATDEIVEEREDLGKS